MTSTEQNKAAHEICGCLDGERCAEIANLQAQVAARDEVIKAVIRWIDQLPAGIDYSPFYKALARHGVEPHPEQA